MLIYKAYKVELDPNNKQITFFKKCCGAVRFAYNWGLRWRMDERLLGCKSLTLGELDAKLNELKKTDYEWLKEIPSASHQNALNNLANAFKRFFGGIGNFPRFKNKRFGVGSFKVTECIHVKIGGIKLPKIGWVGLKEKEYVPGRNVKINFATVSEHSGKWFVSVQVKEEILEEPHFGGVVGIDLGLNSFTTDSDGNKTDAPKPLKKNLKKLVRLQRRKDHKQKGSKNREKSRQKLAKQHFRIACLRKDFLQKLSTELTRTKSIICVEDLNVQGMMKNHCLAQSVGDVNWSEFVRQLDYKCIWYGSKLIKIDRFFPSSKKCSSCGNVNQDLQLSGRTCHCNICNLIIDRDLNAAKNILVEGLRIYSEQLLLDQQKVTPTEENVRPEAIDAEGRFQRRRNQTLDLQKSG